MGCAQIHGERVGVIPSVIGAQVRRGIEEFLRTTFQVTNPFFRDTLDELLRDGDIFKGPYLSAKLPFLASAGGRKFFQEVLPPEFPPHRHQEQAWERLDWLNGQSTIVATGTGVSFRQACMKYSVDNC
jgi:DEAD/DEAH box helicase domain-containing protein